MTNLIDCQVNPLGLRVTDELPGGSVAKLALAYCRTGVPFISSLAEVPHIPGSVGTLKILLSENSVDHSI